MLKYRFVLYICNDKIEKKLFDALDITAAIWKEKSLLLV